MIQRRDGAAAGRQHRVDHQHDAVGKTLGQLRIILRGDRGALVPLQPDVADARVWHEFQDGVEDLKDLQPGMILEAFRRMARVPFVVGLNRAAADDNLTVVTDATISIGLGTSAPVSESTTVTFRP